MVRGAFKRRKLASVSCLLCLLSALAPARADLDPREIKLDGEQYDLSGLTETSLAEMVRDTPPTKTTMRVYVSLWDQVAHDDESKDEDQCPSGTRVCAVVINEKPPHAPRVINVIPIAGEYGSAGTLDIKASGTSAKDSDLMLTYSGGTYLNSSQRAEILFRCQNDADKGTPTVDSYENNLLTLRWSTSYACPLSSGDHPPATTPRPPRGKSVFTIFFYLLIVAGIAYFVIGSWINKSQYGATGWDMLPQRDFWRDVPFLVKEFFQPSRSARAGYSSL